VNGYSAKYKLDSQLLDDNPQLVSLVHQDLAKMLSQSKRGRGFSKDLRITQPKYRWNRLVKSQGGEKRW
jgi:hypothetical protein